MIDIVVTASWCTKAISHFQLIWLSSVIDAYVRIIFLFFSEIRNLFPLSCLFFVKSRLCRYPKQGTGDVVNFIVVKCSNTRWILSSGCLKWSSTQELSRSIMYTKNVDKNYPKTPNIFLPIFILKALKRYEKVGK